jgi:hypothetical protein
VQEFSSTTQFASPSLFSNKVSGAVLESKLGAIDGGTRILLTYKGKPKGTYLDFSVIQWQEEK